MNRLSNTPCKRINCKAKNVLPNRPVGRINLKERATRLCRQPPLPRRQCRKPLLIGSPSSLPFEKANGEWLLEPDQLMDQRQSPTKEKALQKKGCRHLPFRLSFLMACCKALSLLLPSLRA